MVIRTAQCAALITVVCSAVNGASVYAQVNPGANPLDVAGLAHAGFEDYRTSAGRMVDGELHVMLDAHAAAWQPWGQDGPTVRAHVFAADGAPARTPGPLIRVRVGTPVRVTLRNRFDEPVIVRGLRDRGALAASGPPPSALLGDSVIVGPGETAEVRFTPRVPGTFFYLGRTFAPGDNLLVPTVFPVRSGDRSMFGVLIVDPALDAPLPDERILLITHWADPRLPHTFLPATRFFVNGRSWPHTERLVYEQHDTIRWRVINVTGREHPMHLHGAYFHVDARGDQLREQVFAPAQRRLAVTETLAVTQTMRISWVPHAPGNWIFHCHFMRHMSWLQTSPVEGEAPAHAHDAPDVDRMGGLVIGVHVRPAPEYVASNAPARRRLDLHITRKPGVFGDAAGYGFVLQDGAVPAADSVHFPGSPIVLRRGEPSEIVVRNRADVGLGVHWHGLELESRGDGVPGWSGIGEQVVPSIAPGDSLLVRITPPRAGTFMYHAHSEPGHQLAQGLYGVFLVVDEDPDVPRPDERLFLLGSLGTGEDAPPAVNGLRVPPPIELEAGTSYRLRFMHISPDDDKRVSLMMNGAPVTWQFVAKDGADLPAAQVRVLPADLRIRVGETYDYVWTPDTAGEGVLRVLTTFDAGVGGFPRDAPPPHTLEIPVRVH